MRILVISFAFPPYSVIGAIRVGQTAKHLMRWGHDVRVIAASPPADQRTLPVEIPSGNVVYTPWADVDRPWAALLSAGHALRAQLREQRTDPARPADEAGGRVAAGSGGRRQGRTIFWHLRRAYRDIVHIPDEAVGWLAPATLAASELARGWRPDVVLASGPPFTAFVVARRLAAQFGTRWVADLRDLWFGNPYTQFSGWRHQLVDEWLERRVLGTASGMVTVSEPLARDLRSRYPRIPVEVVLNGFDTDAETEMPTRPAVTASTNRPRPDATLRLVYTGNLHPRRDLGPLVDALGLMGEDARAVSVEVIGNRDESLAKHYQALANEAGVGSAFHWMPPIPHAQSLEVQRAADALLLVLSNEASEEGIFTGKLFEYLAARRPILVIGLPTGVAAKLVQERDVGAVAASPEAIAIVLREWVQRLRTEGSLPDVRARNIEDFSRAAQTRVLERLLQRVAGATADPAPAIAHARPLEAQAL
jgi:glycosyltransferase involved in cell wall biosynthesis